MMVIIIYCMHQVAMKAAARVESHAQRKGEKLKMTMEQLKYFLRQSKKYHIDKAINGNQILYDTPYLDTASALADALPELVQEQIDRLEKDREQMKIGKKTVMKASKKASKKTIVKKASKASKKVYKKGVAAKTSVKKASKKGK